MNTYWSRCNNVLWISGAKGVKQEDTAMEGWVGVSQKHSVTADVAMAITKIRLWSSRVRVRVWISWFSSVIGSVANNGSPGRCSLLFLSLRLFEYWYPHRLSKEKSNWLSKGCFSAKSMRFSFCLFEGFFSSYFEAANDQADTRGLLVQSLSEACTARLVGKPPRTKPHDWNRSSSQLLTDNLTARKQSSNGSNKSLSIFHFMVYRDQKNRGPLLDIASVLALDDGTIYVSKCTHNLKLEITSAEIWITPERMR